MLHLQHASSFPSAAETRHILYKALVVLWVALCMLAAGDAMAAPARTGQIDAPSDTAQEATPIDAAQIATPADAVRVRVPPYSARVLDTTGTLNTAQVAALNEQILAIEADTRAAVVVYMLPTTGQDAIEEYATRVFREWKLGDAQRDDGILILVALEDRRMRIEVGQGLEGTVPDVLAGRIIDHDMKPRFKRNDYGGGLEAAVSHIGALLRGEIEPPDASRGGITRFGWAFLAALLWGFALGVVRAHRTWKWPVTIGIVAAAPAVAVVVLKNVAIGAILLTFPMPLAFALGFGCGRSRTVRRVTGGIALVIGAMVAIAFVVGSERFGLGLLYALGGGIGCLLLGLIAMGMRAAYKRSLVELGVRCAIVAAIVGYVAFQNPPDPLLTDWESWLPTGLAFGLAMLFGFFPGGVSSDSGDDSRSSSRSSSSSSSSSRSSSGGSSSGGGASGSW